MTTASGATVATVEPSSNLPRWFGLQLPLGLARDLHALFEDASGHVAFAELEAGKRMRVL